jgi:hypothetical protein
MSLHLDANSFISRIGSWAVCLIVFMNLIFLFFIIYSFASGKFHKSAKKQVGLSKKGLMELSQSIGKLSESKCLSMTDLCPICLIEYENTENLLQLPSCNHTYHSKCILTWLEKESSCPNCRNVVTLQSNEIHSH